MNNKQHRVQNKQHKIVLRDVSFRDVSVHFSATFLTHHDCIFLKSEYFNNTHAHKMFT